MFGTLLRKWSAACAVAFLGDHLWFAGKGKSFSIPAFAAGGVDEIRERRYRYVGEEALRMKGRTPDPLYLVPLQQEGWIAEAELARTLLRTGLTRATAGRSGLGRQVLATGRLGPGSGAEQLLTDTLCLSGASRVYPLPITKVAAVGLELDLESLQAVLVLEKDWFECAVFSASGSFCSASRAGGVDHLVEDGRLHFSQCKQLDVPEESLKTCLMEKGLADSEAARDWSVWGTPHQEGRTTAAGLTAAEIAVALAPTLSRIVDTTRQSFATLSPDRLDSLHRVGLHLCGEGAAIPGLAELLSARLELSVKAHGGDVPVVVKGLEHLLAKGMK